MTAVSWVEIPAVLFAKSSQFWSKAGLLQCSGQEFSRNFRAKLKVFSAAKSKTSDAIGPLFLVLFILRLDSNYCILPWQFVLPTSFCAADCMFFPYKNYCGVMGGIWVLISPPPPNNQVLCIPRTKQLFRRFSIKLNPRQIVDKMICLNVIKLNPRQTVDRNNTFKCHH